MRLSKSPVDSKIKKPVSDFYLGRAGGKEVFDYGTNQEALFTNFHGQISFEFQNLLVEALLRHSRKRNSLLCGTHFRDSVLCWRGVS